MRLSLSYLYNFVMFCVLLLIFFLKKGENNRFKKSQFAKFFNTIFLFLLKTESVGRLKIGSVTRRPTN